MHVSLFVVDFIGRELGNYSLALPEAYKTPGKKYLFNLNIYGLNGLITPASTVNLERTLRK